MMDQDKVALVSMPWMALQIPSIQLAVLAGRLNTEGIDSDIHELFIDYAAWLTPDLYDRLSNSDGTNAEWIFASCYYGPEDGNWLYDFLPLKSPMYLNTPEIEDELLRVLVPATDRFLDAVVNQTDWGRYDVIGFTLTINQVAASMAIARRIKLRWPSVRIICGGNACSGPSGTALLRICPYLDIAVRTEGEEVLSRIIQRLRSGEALNGIPGISYRSEGTVVESAPGPLVSMRGPRSPLNFDSYFARLQRHGLADSTTTWLPFESSRGCWWGEKMQCTFCGLHEIMKFRSRSPDDVLVELDHLHVRYGLSRFFCVDLIVPKDYYETLFEVLAQGERDYTIFYEIKANMTRDKAEILRAAGVRWVQPGIESLDGEVLKLMRKGVHPLQNVQLLKWARELGIRATWNIITGTPGEDPAAYDAMVTNIERMHHLQPPTTLTEFELHRFSPYFDHPGEFNIRKTGPMAAYREIFPVSDADLADLVYRYDYEVDRPAPVREYTAGLKQAVSIWRSAFQQGAALVQVANVEGTSTVVRRYGGTRRDFALNQRETILYNYIDELRTENDLADRLAAEHPNLFASPDISEWIGESLDHWDSDSLVMRCGSQVVGLAVRLRHDIDQDWSTDITGPAPLPYLGGAIELAA